MPALDPDGPGPVGTRSTERLLDAPKAAEIGVLDRAATPILTNLQTRISTLNAKSAIQHRAKRLGRSIFDFPVIHRAACANPDLARAAQDSLVGNLMQPDRWSQP